MKDNVFRVNLTLQAASERVARALIELGYQGPESVVDMTRRILERLTEKKEG